MPAVEVVLIKEADGTVPLIDWLDRLPMKARAKCVAALTRLESLGHELRRPEADYLRDGIYELRVRLQTVNYRMLCFFHGRAVCVVSHGIVKEERVPVREIDLATLRRARFKSDPARHTFQPGGL